MKITLIRHGESLANTREVKPHEYGDFRIPLTKKGVEQARAVGAANFTADEMIQSLVYASPYLRTRQTLENLFAGIKGFNEMRKSENYPKYNGHTFKVYEDVRIREIDRGYEAHDEDLIRRKHYGWFYYRFPAGEAPADCYDRVSTFLESMMRQVERRPGSNGAKRDVVIVTHGILIRCFVMRFMHLSVEQFDTLDNPRNCDCITIANRYTMQNPQFVSGTWGIEGLRVRDPDFLPFDLQVQK